MKKYLLCAFIAVCAVAPFFSEQPYWWNNPHRDDDRYMYERGEGANAKTEQDARNQALLAAKQMLVERIGISPSLAKAGIGASPAYAIVNVEVADSATEKNGAAWNAWVLVKYPQEEKKTIIERWNASLASMADLEKKDARIPVQFSLALSTADGREAYRAGEVMSFSVHADADCYLLLVDHQSDGSTVLLFPNRFQPSSFVKKNQVVSIPSVGSSSFQLVVGEPFGDDRIEAIAATGKSLLHARCDLLVRNLPAMRTMVVVPRDEFFGEIAPALAASKDTDTAWSRAVMTLSTFNH